MVRNHIALFAALISAATALAGSTSGPTFDESSWDFGPVPRGPAVTHQFRLTNHTGGPMHIASVRVSCGCTTAWALANDLAPGQESAIVAQMDTRRFSGDKTVTIFVQLDQPHWQEMQLVVHAYGTSDVSMNPESLAFGRIKRGTAPTARVTLTLQGDLQITASRAETAYIRPHVRELGRDGGTATYEVSAQLRQDTPVGIWYSDVWLYTNSASTPQMRVPLTVEIEKALSATPRVAVLGDVKKGGEAERRVVIRGDKPFRITSIAGTDDQLSAKDSTSESKPVHVLTIRLKAAKPGEFDRNLRVFTDLPEEREVTVRATAVVTP
jgi:hypothetical protein